MDEKNGGVIETYLVNGCESIITNNRETKSLINLKDNSKEINKKSSTLNQIKCYD